MSNKLEKLRGCLRTNFLTIGTMAGVIGGVIFGLILRNCKETWSEREVMYVSYIGEIFLRMLKALILPLIVPSLITAVGSLDMSLSGIKSSIIPQCLKEYQLSNSCGRPSGWPRHHILPDHHHDRRGDGHHPGGHHPPWSLRPREGISPCLSGAKIL